MKHEWTYELGPLVFHSKLGLAVTSVVWVVIGLFWLVRLIVKVRANAQH